MSPARTLERPGERDREALGQHVRDDEEAEEQDQRGGDEELRGQAAQAVVVNVRAGRTAGRASPLDHRASAVRADQVLTAHLVPLPVAVPWRTWRDLQA
jgi:hypothetical protein